MFATLINRFRIALGLETKNDDREKLAIESWKIDNSWELYTVS